MDLSHLLIVILAFRCASVNKATPEAIETAKRVYNQEFQLEHDQASKELESQQNRIQSQENFMRKFSLLLEAVGIIGDILVMTGMPSYGLMTRGASGCVNFVYSFYSKRNVMRTLEFAESILKKYDTIRLEMNRYLSPVGVYELPSLQGHIKQVQEKIEHIKHYYEWSLFEKNVHEYYLNLKNIWLNSSNEKALEDDTFIPLISTPRRVFKMMSNYDEIVNNEMCDEANLLHNIITKIIFEHDKLEKILLKM